MVRNINTSLLISELAGATKLITAGKASTDELLKILGKITASNTICLYKNKYENGDLKSFDFESEWCDDEKKSSTNDGQLKNIDWNLLANLKETLLKNTVFQTNNSLLNNELRFIFSIQKNENKLFLPLYSNAVFWGFISFSDFENDKNWCDLTITTITAIADNWGIFIYKNELENINKEQQNELLSQNSFYHNLLNKIPLEIVVFNAENKYVFINENTISNTETREWLIGKTDIEYSEYRNKPITIAAERTLKLNAVKSTKTAIKFEENFELPDGSIKSFMRVLHPILGINNELEFIIGYGIEITELKQKDKLILKLQNVIENSPIGVALLNKDGNYYYMNKSHANYFKYTQNELLGKSWKTIYEPAETEKIENNYFPLLMENKNWNGETLGITKTGEHVYQDIVLSLFDDGDLSCLSVDLTQTKKELNNLRISSDNLELALKAANLGMWMLDFTNSNFDINNTTREILDISNDKIESSFNFKNWIALIHPDDRKKVIKKVLKHISNYLIDNSNLYNLEYRIIQKNGDYKWVLSVGRITSLHIAGNPETMTGFLLDINAQKLADEKIKQSEIQYRDLVESLKEIIFKVDLEGNIEFLNKSWTTITGFNIADCLQKNIVNFVHEDDKNSIVKKINLLKSNKIDFINEKYKFTDVSGHVIWVNFNASLQKDFQGNVTGILGSAENVTEIENAEFALVKNKEILEKVVSSIDDVIFTYDIINNKTIYISASCKKMTGYSDEDFHNNKIEWSELVSAEHIDLYKQVKNDLINKKITQSEIEYKIEFGDQKTIKWIRDKKNLILDDLGNPIRLEGVKLDITNIILAEVNMAKSEEKYRLISENIQDVVTILDSKGNFYYASPSAEKITGYSEEFFLKNNLKSFIHPDDIERVQTFLQNEIFPNALNKITYKLILSNGNFISVESVMNFLESNGEKALILASSRDISIQVEAELNLTKSLEKEKSLGELKSRFVIMASHEFRTPLSIMKSSTQLIQMYLDKNEKGVLNEIHQDKIVKKTNNILFEIDRITELMTDVLTLGKMEANKIKATLLPVNLNQYITDYLALDAVNYIDERNIVFSSNNCESCQVNIDAKLFSQVLQNGISNAIKYSSSNSIIEINLTRKENLLEIVIKDYGIGIPADEIANIFESFFRSSNVENISGTGIGMSIIKMFVEMNNGTISIESELEKGTSLIINLPIFEVF
ncbi:MAG: PAS domain S-box protein [Bacteroidia bacterium]|nr:PAS domain S-box protein [Bacteroidia bacterium]